MTAATLTERECMLLGTGDIGSLHGLEAVLETLERRARLHMVGAESGLFESGNEDCSRTFEELWRLALVAQQLLEAERAEAPSARRAAKAFADDPRVVIVSVWTHLVRALLAAGPKVGRALVLALVSTAPGELVKFKPSTKLDAAFADAAAGFLAVNTGISVDVSAVAGIVLRQQAAGVVVLHPCPADLRALVESRYATPEKRRAA